MADQYKVVHGLSNGAIFNDAEYLQNGYRYAHSYYRRRIENRTQAFEWHQFQ